MTITVYFQDAGTPVLKPDFEHKTKIHSIDSHSQPLCVYCAFICSQVALVQNAPVIFTHMTFYILKQVLPGGYSCGLTAKLPRENCCAGPGDSLLHPSIISD